MLLLLLYALLLLLGPAAGSTAARSRHLKSIFSASLRRMWCKRRYAITTKANVCIMVVQQELIPTLRPFGTRSMHTAGSKAAIPRSNK